MVFILIKNVMVVSYIVGSSGTNDRRYCLIFFNLINNLVDKYNIFIVCENPVYGLQHSQVSVYYIYVFELYI